MDRTGMITMSMRELDRLKAIQAVAEGLLMPWRAAERLGISRRQVERLTNRYRSQGVAGLISRKREQPSNHQLPAGLADHALAIIRERFAFGLTRRCAACPNQIKEQEPPTLIRRTELACREAASRVFSTRSDRRFHRSVFQSANTGKGCVSI
jgi:hypothetical protein